jgi:7-cyano-7-deazaguanine synthase
MDIRIDTPLVNETKRETLKRIVEQYGIDVYKDTYSCYKGHEASCGKCPACIERLDAFEFNGYKDPIKYKDDVQ